MCMRVVVLAALLCAPGGIALTLCPTTQLRLSRRLLCAKGPWMGAPSVGVWNEPIKEAWATAYSSADGEHDYEITDIEGKIPPSLRGSVLRNGPGNFERGGERFAHVLDGDGLLCRFSFDGQTGRASFASRFVATPEFVEEAAADAVLHRNTFGTQPAGVLANLGNLKLSNVSGPRP